MKETKWKSWDSTQKQNRKTVFALIDGEVGKEIILINFN